MARLNQTGSHVVALVVGVLVIAVIGVAGYKVYQRSNNAGTPTNSTTAISKAAPGNISNNADLTQAAKSLDAASSQVDGSLNDNNLNSDLNDML